METHRFPECPVPVRNKTSRAYRQVIPLDICRHYNLPEGPHALCKDHAPNACFCPTCAQNPERFWQGQPVQSLNVAKALEYGYDVETWVKSSSYLGKAFWCSKMRNGWAVRTQQIESITHKEDYKCSMDGCRCASTTHGPHRLIFPRIFQVFGAKKGFEEHH